MFFPARRWTGTALDRHGAGPAGTGPASECRSASARDQVGIPGYCDRSGAGLERHADTTHTGARLGLGQGWARLGWGRWNARSMEIGDRSANRCCCGKPAAFASLHYAVLCCTVLGCTWSALVSTPRRMLALSGTPSEGGTLCPWVLSGVPQGTLGTHGGTPQGYSHST